MDTIIYEQAEAPASEADALLDAAFGPERLAKASYRLREGSRPLEGLSFTAREKNGGRLVGVISFWPLRVSPGGAAALLLGPLAVHPAMQRRGIGAALIERGLAAARARGHGLVFLVGDAPYYGRFGFAPVTPPGRLLLPGPFDPERLLYHELRPGSMNADVRGMLLPEWRFAARDETRRR